MRTKFISLLLLAILATACNQSAIDDPTKIDLNLKSQALVKADNEFGLDLFKEINATEQGNFNISPLSISLALAMTYNGAQGETKIAMEEALRLAGLTTDEINQAYQSLIKSLLEADSKVTLEIAQSIWYRQGYNVLENFKTVNKTFYDAEVNELDFGRADATDVINGWIEDKTHDKIKDMIDDVNPDYALFLINAIYFNGEWQSKFDKSNTQERPFYVTPTQTEQVDMMQKEDSVNIQSNELFMAIEMPYGRGNFNMVVLLPNEDKTVDEVAKALTPANWEQWMASFQKENNIDIQLPKFKDEFDIELNDILKAMGMEVAFTRMADFSGINGGGELWIDFVQHNTFIDVNEKGTEAAAATVVGMRDFAMPLYNSFYANRPFIYAITEKETGAILFIGKIVKPMYN